MGNRLKMKPKLLRKMQTIKGILLSILQTQQMPSLCLKMLVLTLKKKTCEEVIVLLSKLSATANKEFLEIAQNNRRLLSVIDLSDLAGADPDAVQQVEDMINDLIDAGEDERQKVKEAALAAAEVLKAAIKVHEEKLNALFWAAGEVEVYTEKVDDLETKAAAATKATASAQNTHDLAVIHQDTTQESFDFETDRVKGEEEIFVEVTRLLNTLK